MGDWGAFFQIKNKKLTYVDYNKYSFESFFHILLTPNNIINNGRNKDRWINYIDLFETKNVIDAKIEKNQPNPYSYIDYAILLDWDLKKILLFNDYIVNYNPIFTSILLEDIHKVWPTWQINYCWFGIKDILIYLNVVKEIDGFDKNTQTNYLEVIFERKQDYIYVTKEYGDEIEFDEKEKYDENIYFISRNNRHIDFFITLIESNQIKNYSTNSYDILKAREYIFTYVKSENKPIIDPPHLIEDRVCNGAIIAREQKEIYIWWTKSGYGIDLMNLIKIYWNDWTVHHLETGLQGHLEMLNQLTNENIIQLKTEYQNFFNKYSK